MALGKIDDIFRGRDFFCPEVTEGKSFISTYSKVGEGRSPNRAAFYCVWTLWARYFSLPLRGTRGAAGSFDAPEIVDDPFVAKSGRRQTKLLFVHAVDKTRKQTGSSHARA